MKKKTQKRGRPPANRIARNVYLEEKHVEALREIGGGNVSAGIRIMVDRYVFKRKITPWLGP